MSTFTITPKPLCFDCDLAITRQNVVLPEIVGESPRIAFWGMGPGEQEDKQGRPFVGPAGDLLRTSLKTLKIKNYQLINSVLCVLPGNREPKPYQARACAPHVKSLLAPTVEMVVLLGRVALRCAQGRFGDELSISRSRGKLIISQYLNLPCVATYHPSYLRRQNLNPYDFHNFLNDIKRAVIWMDE